MKNSLHTILAVLLGAALSSAAIVEEGGGGTVYGSDYIFLLQVPKGWVMDCESAVNQGIQALFYPKGVIETHEAARDLTQTDAGC